MNALKNYVESRIVSLSMIIRECNRNLNTSSFEEFLLNKSHLLFVTERSLVFFNTLKEVIETETKENVIEYLKTNKEQCINVLTKKTIYTTTNPIKNVLNVWEVDFLQDKINSISSILAIFS
jgi:hypothetical protein